MKIVQKKISLFIDIEGDGVYEKEVILKQWNEPVYNLFEKIIISIKNHYS